MTSYPTPHTPPRYAVAFAPNPGTLGWLAGSHWLGRCASQLQPLPQLTIDGVAPADLARLTAAPRRHGWHAPLKTPFALAPGADWISLHHAVQAIAHRLEPIALPLLQVQRVGDCLALVPAVSHAANAALCRAAAACVTELHRLAAPLNELDMAAHRAAGLTPQQDALLEQWGHPWVLEEFRFHLPITGSLGQVDTATAERILEAAQAYFSDLPVLTFNSLALFTEPTPGADFVLLDHLEMAR
ncbi:MAG: DUF1045 domain-containing protein [Burkholderiaceae bacterium]|nr:DUF1045 domain-containing protein [Burkholderiaceae bacterium]